jgi:hypothetical protein
MKLLVNFSPHESLKSYTFKQLQIRLSICYMDIINLIQNNRGNLTSIVRF